MQVVTANDQIPEIGFQTENNRTQVRFPLADIMEEFPGGLATLVVQRPGEKNKSVVTSVEMDGTDFVWTVGAYEIEHRGLLMAQVIYSLTDVVAKTKIYRFRVSESLMNSEPAPTDWEDWVDELLEAAAGAHGEAVAAETNALKAEGYAVGTQNGVPVTEGTYFQHNTEYLAGKAEDARDRAEAAAVHPPIIGQNNNWWIWDQETGEYVDSGKPTLGGQMHICGSNEYDPETRIPTIQNPDEHVFYLVPEEDPESHDLFIEWAYINGAWELFGTASLVLDKYATVEDPQFRGTVSMGRAQYSITGGGSVALGTNVTAAGSNSQAEGNGTIAMEDNSHAMGSYNVSQQNDLLVVGNGFDEQSRSNAFRLDKSGEARFAGDIYAGCDYDSTGGNKVATMADLSMAGGVYFVNGTQQAATNAWTGMMSDIASLYEGMTIAYRLPQSGTSLAATLNLTLKNGNTTGAIPVYYTGESRATNQFEAGSVIMLTYYSNSWRHADVNTHMTLKCTVSGNVSETNDYFIPVSVDGNTILTHSGYVMLYFPSDLTVTGTTTTSRMLFVQSNDGTYIRLYVDNDCTFSSVKPRTIPAGSYLANIRDGYMYIDTYGYLTGRTASYGRDGLMSHNDKKAFDQLWLDVTPYIENGNSASRAYSKGQLFFWENVLHITTSSILQGIAFNDDETSIIHNCKAITIEEYVQEQTSAVESRVDGSITSDVEETRTASKAYSKGNIFFLEGKLYVALKDIAQGAYIVTGGPPQLRNAQETTIKAVLSGMIDDTAGDGDTTKVWSADKSAGEIAGLSNEISELDGAISAKYTKPVDGIPAVDLASGVIPDVSGFYTKPSGGIPKTDLASAVQTSLGKADTALQGNDVATAVDAWLDENITNPDSPPLDRSLTSSSAAAPADIVGDLSSALQYEAQSINLLTNATKRSGYRLDGNGVLSSLSFYDVYEISYDGTYSTFNATLYSGTNYQTKAVSFKNASDEVISTLAYPSTTGASNFTDQAIPAGTAKIFLGNQRTGGAVAGTPSASTTIYVSERLEDIESDLAGIHEVPSGGATGEVFTKLSSTDYDADWTTIIDDTAGSGDGGVTWSAGKIADKFAPISSALNFQPYLKHLLAEATKTDQKKLDGSGEIVSSTLHEIFTITYDGKYDKFNAILYSDTNYQIKAIAFYDSSENVISTMGYPTATTGNKREFEDVMVPSGTAQIILCNQKQYGSASASYYDTESKRLNDIEDDIAGDKTALSALTYSTKNLYDDSKKSIGLIYEVDGSLLPSFTDYYSSDYTEISPSTIYVISAYNILTGEISREGLRKAFYDAGKTFISGSQGGGQFRTPSNAKYIRFSMNKTVVEKWQLERRSFATKYIPYHGYVVADESDEMFMNFPSKTFAVTGLQYNWYLFNICPERYENEFKSRYFIYTNTKMHQYGRFLRLEASNSSTDSISVVAEANSGAKYGSKAFTVVCKNPYTLDAVSVLILGDSTTANGYVAQYLHQYTGTENQITTLGTKGTYPYNHEGRSGWRLEMYFTQSNNNPFYNPSTQTFDAEYYFTQTGVSVPDIFIINLGINDMHYNSTVPSKARTTAHEYIEKVNAVIESLRNVSENIKIAICLTTPPNVDPYSFGAAGTNIIGYDDYRIANLILCEMLIDEYDYRQSEGLYLIPINAVLDTKYNMPTSIQHPNSRSSLDLMLPNEAANVHPNDAGYHQIADEMYAFICSLYAT